MAALFQGSENRSVTRHVTGRLLHQRLRTRTIQAMFSVE